MHTIVFAYSHINMGRKKKTVINKDLTVRCRLLHKINKTLHASIHHYFRRVLDGSVELQTLNNQLSQIGVGIIPVMALPTERSTSLLKRKSSHRDTKETARVLMAAIQGKTLFVADNF